MPNKILTDLKDILNPARTCLVLWDVQNALVKSIFNRGEFLAGLKKLLESARKNKVEVVYTKITPLPLEYQSGWAVYRNMQRFGVVDPAKLPQGMRPGSPEAEIFTDIGPVEKDFVIPKHFASIFIGTEFESMMRNRNIETLVFSGIATEIGIDSSARDAGNRGFYPVVVSDCVSSSSREMHEAALKVLPAVSLVIPSDKIMEQWS